MSDRTRIITIDGPAGVGKSTIARLLAEKLHIPFLDTGAMFRAIAYNLGETGINLPDEELAKKCACFHFTLNGAGNNTRLFCNQKLIGEEIRTEKVAQLASLLSQRPEIRNVLLNAQREIGKNSDLVTEGRDMGTIVFPEAFAKFYLEATPKIRAERRRNDLIAMGKTAPGLEELQKIIEKRDFQDKNRPIAPLKPAADAIIIDTSELGINDVLNAMLAKIHSI